MLSNLARLSIREIFGTSVVHTNKRKIVFLREASGLRPSVVQCFYLSCRELFGDSGLFLGS